MHDNSGRLYRPSSQACLDLAVYFDTTDNVLSVRDTVDHDELGSGLLSVLVAQSLPLAELGDLPHDVSQVVPSLFFFDIVAAGSSVCTCSVSAQQLCKDGIARGVRKRPRESVTYLCAAFNRLAKRAVHLRITL